MGRRRDLKDAVLIHKPNTHTHTAHTRTDTNHVYTMCTSRTHMHSKYTYTPHTYPNQLHDACQILLVEVKYKQNGYCIHHRLFETFARHDDDTATYEPTHAEEEVGDFVYEDQPLGETSALYISKDIRDRVHAGWGKRRRRRR